MACDLPDDILFASLCPLASHEKKAVRGACSRFRSILNAAVTAVSLTGEDLAWSTMRENELQQWTAGSCSDPLYVENHLPLHLASHFPSLAWLRLSDGPSGPVTDAQLARLFSLEVAALEVAAEQQCCGASSTQAFPAPVLLPRFTCLKRLDLKHCHNIGPEGLRHLAACRTLRFLATSRWANAASLLELRGLSQLQGLDLGDSKVDVLTVDDAALAQVTHLRALKALSLRRCIAVSATGVNLLLSSLPGLEYLDISHCRKAASPATFAPPLTCCLSTIEASGCNSFVDAVLAAAAAACPRLSALRVAGTPLTNVGLAAAVQLAERGGLAPALAQLSALSLGSQFELDNAGAAALSRLPSLQRLQLGNFNLTAPLGSLRAVGSGPCMGPPFFRLRELRFGSSMNYPNRGLRHILPLPCGSPLEHVAVYGLVAAADSTVAHLACQKTLKHLELHCGYHLSTAGLAVLAKLPLLRTLLLHSCPGVSDTDLADLLPGVGATRSPPAVQEARQVGQGCGGGGSCGSSRGSYSLARGPRVSEQGLWALG